MINYQSQSISMAALQSKYGIYCPVCGPFTRRQPKGARPGNIAFGQTTDRFMQPVEAALTAEAAGKAQEYNKSMSS